MIRPGGLWIAVALACASGAYAADDPSRAAVVKVRATETRAVTRVELDIGDGAFRVERSGAKAIDIVTPNSSAVFDVSQITANLAGGRVLSARAVPDETGARLRILLDCDCDYAAGTFAGGLALEFQEREIADAPPETTEPASTKAPRRNGSRLAPVSAPAPRKRSAPAQDADPSQVADAPKPSPDRAAEIVLARERLLAQLARAADQGLLEFQSPDVALAPPEDIALLETPDRAQEAALAPDVAPEPAPEPKEPETVDAPPAPEPELEPAQVELPVRAHTARDKVFRPDRADTIVRRRPCIGDGALDTASWISDASLTEEVGRLRGELLDDFDTPKPAVAEALAKLYLAHGLGYEAKIVIASFGARVKNAALFVDLAKVVEGLPLTADGPLALSDHCDGAVRLWRAAAGMTAEPSPTGRGDLGQFSAAYSTLSPILRPIIGPMAMENLADQGALDAAKALRAVMMRAPADYGVALDMAEARYAAANGDFEKAESIYSALSKAATPDGQSALWRLFQSKLSRGAPIDMELSMQLADAAYLARGGPMERPALIASIRARTLTEGLAPALKTLKEEIARRPDDRELLRDVGHVTLERANAGESGPMHYARAVLDFQDEISPDIAGDAARWKVAEELISLGLGNAAIDILAPAVARGAPATKRLAAEAELALGRPEAALKMLETLDDPKAHGLRADALERIGALSEAKTETEAAGAPESEQARRAFLAGDWPAATQSTDAEQRLLAAFMAESEKSDPEADAAPPPAEDVDPDAARAFIDPPRIGRDVSLGDARSVLESSQSTRNIILEALEDG